MRKDARHSGTVDPAKSCVQDAQQRPSHPLRPLTARKPFAPLFLPPTVLYPLLRSLEQILKQLLPPACLLCGIKLNALPGPPYLCPECARACVNQPIAACAICAEPFRSASVISHWCGQCTTSPPPFVWLKAIGLHAEQLQYAVHQLKYANQFQLAEALALLLLSRLRSDIVAFNPQNIIPVPLHPKRLCLRGFNQSLLVARHLGTKLDIPVSTRHLIRTRPTSSQTKLNLAQRHQNILGAFSIDVPLPPRRILLVDDVVTTTATCRECAKVLSHAGHQVAVVALSRASLQH